MHVSRVFVEPVADETPLLTHLVHLLIVVDVAWFDVYGVKPLVYFLTEGDLGVCAG